MTNEKNTTMRAAPWDLRRLPGFDITQFAQVADKGTGKKELALSLEGRKTWFRLACPNGGLVLNALRVTDAMAIFEARVFADTDDRNPLASATATQKADKAKGEAYIRAAQDAALEEALKSAGFSLEISSLAPIVGGEKMAPPSSQTADAGQPVKTPEDAPPEPSPAPIQTDAPRQKAGDDGQQTEDKAVPPPKPVTGAAPRPAPVGPPPHAAPAPRPAPVAPQPHAAPAPENRDAAPVVDINTRQPVAAGDGHPAAAAAPASKAVPAPEQPAEQAEPVPVTYTADMTVDEITARMTLEQAQGLKVKDGTCKGWTLGQVAKDRPASLRWFTTVCPFADNVLKAAASIVLSDLELKMAG